MPYRTTPLVNEQYYHIFNRGVEKRDIFTSEADYRRFFKTFQYYQSAGTKPRFSRYNPDLHEEKIPEDLLVEIIAYCFMPNHFHLLLKQIVEGGISKYVSQLSNSYTKYFNIKYKRIGPLSQGNFKAVLIETNEQLLHVSRYIHLNPFVAGLSDAFLYKYSSLSEYVNNSSSICKKDIIISQFSGAQSYRKFVEDHSDYALSLEIIKHQLLEDE